MPNFRFLILIKKKNSTYGIKSYHLLKKSHQTQKQLFYKLFFSSKNVILLSEKTQFVITKINRLKNQINSIDINSQVD